MAPVAESLTIASNEVDAAPARNQARKRWAQLIKKVYEVDPLICPKCQREMKIVAFIMEADAIRKILRYIGVWKEPERGPPRQNSSLFRTAHPCAPSVNKPRSWEWGDPEYPDYGLDEYEEG